jgi:tRNA(Ile)-lysidine synthase
VIFHVNHQLRGVESDRDEDFVRNLAAQLGLPVFVLRATVPEGNLEQEARRVRYRFFTGQMAEGRCDVVATGHTLDDQAETVLSRFLRGSGTAGLSGIRPVTDSGVIRPLLDLRRTDIRKWLNEEGLRWQEDCSNLNKDFLRNRVRLEIMPQLVALNPSLAGTLAGTAEWAQAEEAYWIDEVIRLQQQHLRPEREAVLIEMGSFLRLPLAVQRRLLRRAVEMVRGSLRGIDFRHVEAMRSLMSTREGSGRIQLPDLDVYRSFDWLRFAPIGYDSRLERNFEVELAVPGTTPLPKRLITIEMELVTGPHVYNEHVDALDSDRCAGSLVLRNWRPGDRYCPAGRTGDEKIKTLFQEHRIPLWQRRHWPVISLGDSIVWTRRFGAAREYAAGPDSQRVLLVRESGESKDACRASVTSVGREWQRVGSRQQPVSGERGAEVS